MKLSGRAVMICGLVVIAISMLISARTWPPQSAIFPMIVSSFIIFMAVAYWLVTIFGKKTNGEDEVMDVKRSEEADQKSSNRQLISICLWVFGFLLLILLFGFLISIPLFMFLYLKCEGKEGWVVSICMSAGVWACFYFLFIWLLQTSFPEGWIMAWLSGA
jgi:hypothetical protein